MNKKQKARVAIILAASLTAVDITSMAAIDVGRPSAIDHPIKVTFKVGKGGYFEGIPLEDPDSTSSNADRTRWVHKFYDLEEDEKGYFTTLSIGARELERAEEEPVWRTAANEEELSFAGWYYMDGSAPVLITDLKEIYSDVVLEGQWYDPDQIKGDLAESGQVTAIGLGSRTLTADEGEVDSGIRELLEAELARTGLENIGEEFWALELDVAGKGKDITITAAVPEDKIDPLSPVTGVYEGYDGGMDVIPTDIAKEKEGYRLTFTVPDGGNVYLANTAELPSEENSIFSSENKAMSGETGLTGKGEYGDNLQWNLDEQGILTISGQGEMEKASNDYPWRDDSCINKIKKIVIETGVTTVAASAFYGCEELTEVEIGESVTEIQKLAFARCDKLAVVQIPDSVVTIGAYAFYGCESLKDVIPVSMGVLKTDSDIRWKLDSQGTMTISGKGEMDDPSKASAYPWDSLREEVKKLIVEEGIANIGDYAFQGCVNLVSAKLPKSLTRIGDYAFSRCAALADIEIPDSVEYVGDYSFEGCTSLKDVTIVGKGSCGDNLQWEVDSQGTLTIRGQGPMKEYRYGHPWLSYDKDIKKVVLGQGVTSIAANAFEDCINLTTVLLPDSLTSIGNFAFSKCAKLADIQIGAAVVIIEVNAFYECVSLPGATPVARGVHEDRIRWELTMDGNMTIEGTGDLPERGSWYKISSKENVKNLVIKEGITSIGTYNFFKFVNMETVELPKSLTTMEGHAFAESGLTSIVIPEKVEVIRSDTFTGCGKLKSVTLSEGLLKIERKAFKDTAIPSVVIPKTVEAVAQKAFPDETQLIFARSEGLTKTPLEATGKTSFTSTNNKSQHNYPYYASQVMNSYLYQGEDGSLYRVEYNPDTKKMTMEQYTSNFQFEKSWDVPMELPIFGGFYEGENHLYGVFGKGNKEDDKTEVVRIVKYSKDLERLDSVSFYGMNTVTPFHAGSLRIAENDKDLFVHTSHLMYRTDDGLRHQANMTMAVNKEGMTRTYSNFLISNNSTGYVSHSFNQFVKTDGDKVVTVDHGDGYPRGGALTVYKAADLIDDPDMYLIFPVKEGGIGHNYTGMTIGGLEVSDSRYLVAVSSIDQNNYANSKERNIYLISVDKNDPASAPKTTQITNYGEGSGHNVTTPQLVKISQDLYAVMWEEGKDGGTVKTVFFDGEGSRLGGGAPGSFEGNLSDCQPAVCGDRVIWYVTDGKNLTFYSYAAEYPGSSANIEVTKTILKPKGGSSSGGSGGSGGSGSGGGGGSSSGGGGGSSSGGGGGGSKGSSSAGNKNTNAPGLAPGGSTPGGSIPVLTGNWRRDGRGWWLEQADRGYPRGQWARINGATYLFDDAGYMVEGWSLQNGRWYYLMPGSGAMSVGWVRPADNKWYFLNGDGSMATGWIQTSGKWYYLHGDGSMATGWVQVGGKWYYLSGDGSMLANTVTPDGQRVDSDGVWIS